MRLERLILKNFRSYKQATHHFGEVTLLIAPNGSGKTNLLEAIYLLATGISDRAGKIEEMISWDGELGSVSGIVEDKSERSDLSVVLTRGVYMGKRTPKRRYLVDGVGRARATFVGHLPATLFRPEDMRLLEGSPSRRRGYLDLAIGMAHPEYLRALSVYEATLKRRNRLLDQIRDGISKRVELAYWDQSLIKNGEILTNYRRGYIEYLNDHIKVPFGEYCIEYKSSAISPSRLLQYADAEVAVGYTLVGPHKDDFILISNHKFSNSQIDNNIDLMTYGSRGEQRLGVLFLKIGGMEYLEEKRGVKSLLLLDDIFSELDQEHRIEVVRLMEGRQVILTSAEDETTAYFGDTASIIRL
ncbi:DNA replication and repair protein RecF [Candidatus Woesebacteria bacterium]|nr:DNA replication and repair protein RecF [Candidatus Woesebacteria bacterium]